MSLLCIAMMHGNDYNDSHQRSGSNSDASSDRLLILVEQVILIFLSDNLYQT